jgi:hypothetical protein
MVTPVSMTRFTLQSEKEATAQFHHLAEFVRLDDGIDNRL